MVLKIGDDDGDNSDYDDDDDDHDDDDVKCMGRDLGDLWSED